MKITTEQQLDEISFDILNGIMKERCRKTLRDGGGVWLFWSPDELNDTPIPKEEKRLARQLFREGAEHVRILRYVYYSSHKLPSPSRLKKLSFSEDSAEAIQLIISQYEFLTRRLIDLRNEQLWVIKTQKELASANLPQTKKETIRKNWKKGVWVSVVKWASYCVIRNGYYK